MTRIYQDEAIYLSEKLALNSMMLMELSKSMIQNGIQMHIICIQSKDVRHTVLYGIHILTPRPIIGVLSMILEHCKKEHLCHLDMNNQLFLSPLLKLLFLLRPPYFYSQIRYANIYFSHAHQFRFTRGNPTMQVKLIRPDVVALNVKLYQRRPKVQFCSSPPLLEQAKPLCSQS